MDDAELGRILGNIEGTQRQILERLDRWDKRCDDRLEDCTKAFDMLESRLAKAETREGIDTKKLTAIASGIATAVATATAAVIAFFK